VLPGIAVAHGQWVSRDPQGPVRSATTVVLGQGLGQGITLLDPGPSRAWGRQLQQQLNCPRAQRVMELINSHAHAEHVLANSAWAVPVWASANTQASMRQRCPDCLAALRRDLGAPALHGTRIVLPTRRLQEGQGLHAGGREWVVLDMRSAHTESDLVLWSAAEGIALVGPLVDGTGLVLAQGSVQGWLQALQRIEALQPQWLIGQHLVAGPGQAHSALSAQRQALCTLVQQAWQGLDKGWSENEALQQPTQGDARTRRQQRFNLLRVWREMEGLWMARQPMPAACSAPDVGR
jgi:glyoxylase-like metal-dependent hydrolase (beta-lactamase superfamily II)